MIMIMIIFKWNDHDHCHWNVVPSEGERRRLQDQLQRLVIARLAEGFGNGDKVPRELGKGNLSATALENRIRGLAALKPPVVIKPSAVAFLAWRQEHERESGEGASSKRQRAELEPTPAAAAAAAAAAVPAAAPAPPPPVRTSVDPAAFFAMGGRGPKEGRGGGGVP